MSQSPNDIHIKITGDPKPAEQSMDRVEKRAEGLGQRIHAVGRGLQSAFRAIALPVALFLGLERVARLIDEARERAEKFREELSKVGDVASDKLQSAIMSERLAAGSISEEQAARIKLAREQRAEEEKINAAFIERKKAIHSLGGVLEAVTTGTRSVTAVAEAERDREAALKRIRDHYKAIAEASDRSIAAERQRETDKATEKATEKEAAEATRQRRELMAQSREAERHAQEVQRQALYDEIEERRRLQERAHDDRMRQIEKEKDAALSAAEEIHRKFGAERLEFGVGASSNDAILQRIHQAILQMSRKF